MKKSFHCIVFSLAALLLASCSALPKVTADVEGYYPARSADSVVIFESAGEVPAAAQTIGTVKVTDGGMTPTYKCLYGNMLAMAVTKTAESGGNALRVDQHKTPDFWSSCHRVRGTMLLLPDSLAKSDSRSSLKALEDRRDSELLEITNKQIEKTERFVNNPKNVARLDLGYGVLNSELVTPIGTYKHKSGFVAALGYQHYWKLFGLGVDVVDNYMSLYRGIDLTLFYVGPNVGIGCMLGSNFRFDCTFGVGYGLYKESSDWGSYHESRVASKSDLGLEYMVGKNVGLGVRLCGFVMSMKKPEDSPDDEFYGFKRLDILGGVRVYF